MGAKGSVKDIAKKYDISEHAALDVWYLRTRTRWTKEAEAELVRMIKAGQFVNIMEWPPAGMFPGQKSVVDELNQAIQRYEEKEVNSKEFT